MNVQISASCNDCTTEKTFTVNLDNYEAWLAKDMLAQDAFPHIPREDREILISKTCSDCFDKLTGYHKEH